MKKLAMYGAVASIFLLTAGPAALAQNYNPSYGQNQSYGQNYGRATDRIPTRAGTGAAQTGTGAAQSWNRSGMSN